MASDILFTFTPSTSFVIYVIPIFMKLISQRGVESDMHTTCRCASDLYQYDTGAQAEKVQNSWSVMHPKMYVCLCGDPSPLQEMSLKHFLNL